MKLYISGRITGDADYERKFRGADNQLIVSGYDPINPCDYVTPGTDWTNAMRIVLAQMMGSDGVALLPGWRRSRGARIERRIALWLKIPVRPLGAWLRESMPEPQTAREAYEKGSYAGLLKYLDKKYPGIHTFGEEQKEKENG
jgi:hypothetical protein